MKSIAIDPSTKDLIMSGNKFTLNNSSNSLSQNISNNVRIWLGEWFADLTIGINYLEFENGRWSDEQIRFHCINQITKNQYVLAVTKLDVSRVRSTGKITLDWEVQTVQGIVAGVV